MNQLSISNGFPFFSNKETRKLQNVLDVPHSELLDVRINNQFVDLDTRGQRFGRLRQKYYVKMTRMIPPKKKDENNKSKFNRNLKFSKVRDQIKENETNWKFNECLMVSVMCRINWKDRFKLYTDFVNQANITMRNFGYMDELETNVEIAEMSRTEEFTRMTPF